MASVIILKGESWGNKYPETIKWARELLIRTAVEFKEDQESFLSEMDDLGLVSTAMPLIWAEEPNEKEFRKAVARIIFHTNSEVVGKFTFSTTTVHDRLGDDHLRVIHAILYRSKYVFELQDLLSQ